MEILYYDYNNRTWVSSGNGAKLSKTAYPAIGLEDKKWYEIHVVTVADSTLTPLNLSTRDIQSLHAAIDVDFTSSTNPMCRTNEPAYYDLSQLSSGIIIVYFDGETTRFAEVVNGYKSKKAYMQIKGYDSSGERVLNLTPNWKSSDYSIVCEGDIDPNTGELPGIPTNYYTKAETDAIAAGKVSQTLSTAYSEISAVLDSCRIFLRSGSTSYNVTFTKIWTWIKGKIFPGSMTVGNLTKYGTGGILEDAGVAVSTDGTLTSNSDAKIPTEKAVKTYADTKEPALGFTPEDSANKGAANGYAELDSGGKVPSAQLPAYVDDVIEVADYASLPGTGTSGVIYVTLDTNLTYRWSGSAYVEISASLVLGETSSTAYRGDRGKTAYDHSQLTSGNPHSVSKSDVGLGNVTNILNKLDGTTAPTANDDSGDGYSVGSKWVDVTGDKIYFCLDATLTAAVWQEVGAGGGGGLTFTAIATDTNAESGKFYIINASSGTVTLTLPGSPSVDYKIGYCVLNADNTVTIARNGNNIKAAAADLTPGAGVSEVITWSGNATEGWTTAYDKTSIVPDLEFDNGDLVAGVLTITGLKTVAAIVDNSGNQIPFADELNYGASNTTIDFTSFGTLTGTWKIKFAQGYGASSGGGGTGDVTFEELWFYM